MYKIYLGYFIFFASALAAEPWGKDADLCQHKQSQDCPIEKTSLVKWFADQMICFHQEVVSPADGPRSHFTPSSSQYTRDAIAKYGFWEGFLLGCDRLMRENADEWLYTKVTAPDGSYLKYDPIK